MIFRQAMRVAQSGSTGLTVMKIILAPTVGSERLSIPIPNCYGRFVCLDDCLVSCPYWEDCMQEADDHEDGEVGFE